MEQQQEEATMTEQPQMTQKYKPSATRSKTCKIRKAWKQIDKEQQEKVEKLLNNNGVDIDDMVSDDMDITAEGSTKTQQTTCSECNGLMYIMDDGFPTCIDPKCGAIYKNQLDFSPEWNSFGKDDKAGNDCTRCGNPANPLLKESSAACKVFRNTKSSFEMRKIDKWIEWQSMPHKEKALYDEFQYITNIGRIAGIPAKIIDEALIKHKEISEEQMFRGVNRDAIKAASIYIAYRLNGFPRTATEIAKIFMLDKKNATKGCAMAVNILNNIQRHSSEPTPELCKITPAVLLDRYCSPFPEFTPEFVLLAKFIAYKIEKQGLILDNTPQAIASGIIYFINHSCHLSINKHDIIHNCQISDVTIMKCFKKIVAIHENDVLIPSAFMTTKKTE